MAIDVDAETVRLLRMAAEAETQRSKAQAQHDAVNHPKHYTDHPSGIEAIQITEHMGFCVGNAVKYLWRADLKGNAIEDLEKACWYIRREIARRKAKCGPPAAAGAVAGSE